ncbi:alpha/beta hydrolase [Sphingomonas sp. SUN019]|uniref:alpha/beta hydrolase n=1 Tax=Sphingomonas sp. SUN019 TaxID=2937788 RepID=UPI0021645C89|nr:alpha/beta hydrolase [Sphingomonas sp. SUN019]UVO50493.1 alpha/beta hydrolase [Sphingomonas sp. SUN019]
MIRFLLAILLCLPSVAAAATLADFKITVLQLPSDPPGRVIEAPGGGRVTTPAVLFTPASGANIHGPAIVMLTTGPGAHPLEQGQASRFAAERLAARGYTVLSLYGKLEHDFTTVRFADTVWAVKAGLDYLEMSGYEDFVLAGQNYGAIVAAEYLATQPDVLIDNGGERRVKAVVLINPTTNLRAFPRAGLDRPNYAARVSAAEASVNSGRGLYPKSLEPGQGAAPATDPWVGNGVFVQPAEAFMQLWSPAAQARNVAVLAKLSLPTLALISGGDRSTSDRLKTAGRVDIVRFPKDVGNFAGAETRAADAIADWLTTHGLGVRPAVTTDVLDVTTGGGRVLQGVRYAPAGGGDPARPVVMLISGRVGDTIQSSTHWLGWRLAQQGYVAIAPGMRISGVAGFQSSRLTEVTEDIGKWVDKAAALGARRVVLAGHSNGGIWESAYVAGTHDKRVAGLIYIAPTRDSPTYARDHSPPGQYEKDVATARAATAAGRDMDVAIGLMSARAFLDNNGPDARTVHTARVREFDLPGLSITGAKDPLMSEDFVREFSAAYRGNLEQVRYPNGSHGFRENKERIIEDMAAWLKRTFR